MTARRRTRPGGVLIEIMAALAIFTASALVVLSALRQGADGVERASDEVLAADLVLSAVAMIESGIASPESLNGPVPRWADSAGSVWDTDGAAASMGFEDDPGMPSDWELSVETHPSAFAGLAQLTVEARRAASDPESAPAYSLTQIVRLAPGSEDSIGREDPLMDAARRGAREPAPMGRERRP